jgi:hypothetical protein
MFEVKFLKTSLVVDLCSGWHAPVLYIKAIFWQWIIALRRAESYATTAKQIKCKLPTYIPLSSYCTFCGRAWCEELSEDTSFCVLTAGMCIFS